MKKKERRKLNQKRKEFENEFLNFIMLDFANENNISMQDLLNDKEKKYHKDFMVYYLNIVKDDKLFDEFIKRLADEYDQISDFTNESK